MVAVLHANGMDVVTGCSVQSYGHAGSASGAGGQDPLASANGDGNLYKNFRYVSYSTPASAETS